MDLEHVVGTVRTATATGSILLLERAVLDCEGLIFAADELPPPLFDGLVQWIQTPAHLAMRGSWKLLYIFESNWDVLTEAQRATLLGTIVEIYPRYAEWMSCFMIRELLGERYADRRALEALEQLMVSSSDTQRSLIPHGLEPLATATEPDVPAEALARLRAIARDPSAEVRGEAAKFLQKLGAAQT